MKVDVEIKIMDIAQALGGTVVSGDSDGIIQSISNDSREVGNKTLYIPIIGENFDGHDFIEDLCKEGRIAAFLTMKDGYEETAENNNITCIKCDDTLHALGRVSSWYRDAIGPEVIGITGTNGKTTTKEIVSSLMDIRFKTLKNEKNYNNEIGVPFTLLNLSKDHTMAVVEMGMNHPGEIERLTKIAKPQTALITSIGEGHLEFIGSVKNVAHAKLEIVEGMKRGSTLFINRETACFHMVEDRARECGLTLKTFGLDSQSDVHPEKYKLYRDKIEIVYKGEVLTVSLYGIHNVYNVMGAVALAEHYGLNLNEIKKGLESFENIDGRSQIIDRGYVIINDTYNSNPLSSEYALKSVAEIFPERRKIAVLSDMKELGSSAPDLHKDTGQSVFENGFDLLCVYGDMMDSYLEGAARAGVNGTRAQGYDAKEDIVAFLSENLTDNDVVLVKGSRSMKMEEVVNSLLSM